MKGVSLMKLIGWIKLWRAEVDTTLFQEKPFDEWHAWKWIELSASWQTTPKQKKGDLLTSIRSLMETFGWNKGHVQRFLAKLIDKGLISVNSNKGNGGGTRISLISSQKLNHAEHYRTENGSKIGSKNGYLKTAYSSQNQDISDENRFNQRTENGSESEHNIRRYKDNEKQLSLNNREKEESQNAQALEAERLAQEERNEADDDDEDYVWSYYTEDGELK